MVSQSTLLAHMDRTEIPRFRNGAHITCGTCTREGRADIKPMSIWEWLTHARTVHGWSLPYEACRLCRHLYSPGRGFRKHLTSKHSQTRGETLESTPAEKQGIEELIGHAMENYQPGQVMTNAPGGGEHKRDNDDREKNTPTATIHEDVGNNSLVAKRARAAKHNLEYIEFCRVRYSTEGDLCKDVIVCASTVDDQYMCF